MSQNVYCVKSVLLGTPSSQDLPAAKNVSHSVPVTKSTLPAALDAMEIDDAPPERMPEIMDRLKRLGKILKTTTKAPSMTQAPEKGMACHIISCSFSPGLM